MRLLSYRIVRGDGKPTFISHIITWSLFSSRIKQFSEEEALPPPLMMIIMMDLLVLDLQMGKSQGRTE